MHTVVAATFYEVVLAVHIMSVVVAFGVTFAYPLMLSVARRHGPRSLPLVHRIEYTVERVLVNPALALLVLAGIYLASKGHYWSDFFVQWGLGMAIVIGGLIGAVMIPTAKRAEVLAARDLAAVAEGPAELSDEYRMLARRLSSVGGLLSALVLLTILFMALRLGA
jgi:hypothetical protein